jgi:hypothetical protein
MRVVIFCVPASVTFEDVIEALGTVGTIKRYPEDWLRDNSFVVEDGQAYAIVSIDDERELDEEYEPHELQFVSDHVGAYVGFDAEYSDTGLATRLVRAVAERWPCVVDNDVGPMVDSDEFLARLQREPGWQWWRNARLEQ